MNFRIALLSAVCLAGALCGDAAAQRPAAYDSPAVYDGVSSSSQYLVGHDGVRIAISVYRPTRAGQVTTDPLPVIVTQMRSQMDSPRSTEMMRYFTDRGYVWVTQDRRGTGASFGQQTGFVNPNDVKDAKSVIDWAGAQAFSSGRVVTLGCSNQGVWQYGVAALDPQALVAIAPACASPQFFDDAVVMNGVPIFPLAESHFDGACAPPAAGAQGAPPPRSSGAPTSTRPVDDDADGALLREAQAGHTCNAPMLGQFWRSMARDGHNTFDDYQPALADSAITYNAAIRDARVPVLSLGGWYDAALSGQFAAQNYWGGRVIIGPWAHGNGPVQGFDLPDANLDLNAETLRWFDFHAKGIQNGAEKPGVLYYTVNAPTGQEWRQGESWPWAGDRRETLYFGKDQLSATAPTTAEPIIYAGRDVPWFDGAYAPLRHVWNGDMNAADAQSLSQTGAVLAHDTEMTGTPVARLWVSADTPDVNVFAVIEDVSPDGRSTYVTDGRLRASWRTLHPSPWGVEDHHWRRGNAADLVPLTPGEPAELVFDLYPISYVFKAGHRIRVSLVTSIGQDYQDPPLNGGKTPTLTLYRAGEHASRVDLPIVD